MGKICSKQSPQYLSCRKGITRATSEETQRLQTGDLHFGKEKDQVGRGTVCGFHEAGGGV